MSDELGISDEKDKYCCSTERGGVSETGSCTKSGSMMMSCSCCWPAAGTVSGLAEEARSCAFSTQVLGSESLEGCGGAIAVAAPQRILMAEAQLSKWEAGSCVKQSGRTERVVKTEGK